MCDIIVIDRGEKEISSPKQFFEHFGFMPNMDLDSDIDMCLCQIDIEKEFNDHNIPFKYDCNEWFVGDLDNVII